MSYGDEINPATFDLSQILYRTAPARLDDSTHGVWTITTSHAEYTIEAIDLAPWDGECELDEFVPRYQILDVQERWV